MTNIFEPLPELEPIKPFGTNNDNNAPLLARMFCDMYDGKCCYQYGKCPYTTGL